uniref:Uncharacterized protein n=1 Tax=Arundo donax TaxID=35708 RepID=A0A0A9A8H8_ARUDO
MAVSASLVYGDSCMHYSHFRS